MARPLLNAQDIARLRNVSEPISHIEVLSLLDEVERTRALLKRIEFGGQNGGGCSECHSERVHDSDCELAALIA